MTSTRRIHKNNIDSTMAIDMKVIIFDLLGVVFPLKAGGSRKNMQELYNLIPEKSIPFEEFYVRYMRYKLGTITRNEFWQDLTDNPDELEHKYLDSYQLHDNLKSIISSLKSHYQIIALSNHPYDWIRYLQTKFNLDTLFEKIYTSSTLKLEKTDPRLFEKLLIDLKVTAPDCILIDDLKTNLRIAKSCGIKTIHMKTTDDLTTFTPDAEISSLKELESALNNLDQL